MSPDTLRRRFVETGGIVILLLVAVAAAAAIIEPRFLNREHPQRPAQFLLPGYSGDRPDDRHDHGRF
ncbi:hypothetical protein NKI78_31655 [Mesorhizobium sp. M0400]|uniref:hypothetical protein n=1 Tax=Mesorhizobium sp. M0400 TaxID=2956941 RepID=UPI003335DB1D